MFRKIRGKLLELLLLLTCFILFIIVIPTWISICVALTIILVCIIAMVKCNFFGRF